jgi:hypothetical protein
MPERQVPAGLAALSGVRLTLGALTQDAWQRAAGAVGSVYEGWRAAVPVAPVVHTDDTGWPVGGIPAHLMAFATAPAPVYQSRPRHRYQEVQEVILADDAGVMVTDRGRRYDAQAFDGIDQHKCLAPILRSLSDVMEMQSGRSRDFGDSSRRCCRRP